MNARRDVVVIGGPTGSGKTALALQLAQALRAGGSELGYHGAELIGADSVQVYRGFDIGSAKPTPAELHGIAHHMLDVADADDPWDAARFAHAAHNCIADAHARGVLPIVVGGTGLWTCALLYGLADVPPSDPLIRTQLQQALEQHGPEALHARLRELDSAMADRLHVNDTVRVLRALEVFEQTGRKLSEVWNEHQQGSPRYRHLLLTLDRPRELLQAQLQTRFAKMLERGLVHEVAGLLQRFGPNVRPLQSVGYAQVVAHLQGHLDGPGMLAAANKATWVYSRKQRTFFFGNMFANGMRKGILDADDNVLFERANEGVRSFLSS